MRKLNLKAGAKLHNKHHLVLTDARTGEMKQEAWAFNSILEQGFSRLITHQLQRDMHSPGNALFGDYDSSNEGDWAGTTFIGSGTTPVSVTDTTLNNLLGYTLNSYYESEYDFENRKASHTRVAIWDETKLQNTTITEVGLGWYNSSLIVTRALAKDSEGNVISIPKGEFDILTVYSTLYIEISHNYDPLHFDFIEGAPPAESRVNPTSKNALLFWISSVLGRWWVSSAPGSAGIVYFLYFGTNSDPVSPTDPPVKTRITPIDDIYGTPSGFVWLCTPDLDITYDSINKQVRFESQGTGGQMRLGSTQGNTEEGIWEIGLAMAIGSTTSGYMDDKTCPVFRSVFPLAGVWEGTTINDELLGEGDGIITAFSTRWAPVVNNSEVLRIDGITKTKDVDYAIDYSTGEIVLNNAPIIGSSLTCTYGIEQIPKDENHVLDVNFTIQFADGTL